MKSIGSGSALNLEFNNGGNSQVTGNYAATPTDGIFTVSPGEGLKYEIYSLSVDMRLTGNIVVGNYGIAAALTTGISIYSEPTFGTGTFSPILIKTNQDLEKWFSKENKLSDAVFMGKYRLFMDFGQPIVLKSRPEKDPDKLIVKSTENLIANFTSCSNSFMAHGSWSRI